MSLWPQAQSPRARNTSRGNNTIYTAFNKERRRSIFCAKNAHEVNPAITFETGAA
jgi:hypothetical protein